MRRQDEERIIQDRPVKNMTRDTNKNTKPGGAMSLLQFIGLAISAIITFKILFG